MIDLSHKNTKLQYEKNITDEIESVSENNAQIQFGIIKFMERFVQEKKSELSIKNIHAKVYINRYNYI